MLRFHTLLKVDLIGDTLVVRPCAGGIGFRYKDLQTELNRIMRMIDLPEPNEAVAHLVIDLGELTYYGSEFLQSIISMMNRMGQRGGRAVWCNGSEQMLAFLAERGVGDLWPYFATRDEAMSAVVA
jgi:hypothetical protein